MRKWGVRFPKLPFLSCAYRVLPIPDPISRWRWPVLGNSGVAAVASLMSHFVGPPGGVVRQDVLEATELDVNSSDDDYAAWVAY